MKCIKSLIQENLYGIEYVNNVNLIEGPTFTIVIAIFVYRKQHGIELCILNA